MTTNTPPPATPIAVVEDHASLRDELVFHLHEAGYAATGLADGPSLSEHLAIQPCRLVVLDLGLPGEDGLSICQRLHTTRPDIGIVMLTARGMARDRLTGLQGGADAYLVKPTPPAELLAVVANLLRRLPQTDVPVRSTPAATWRFDPRTLVLTTPAGTALDLTYNESRLLQALIRQAPNPADRRQLVEALGGHYLDFDERRLEVAISRLRRKLQQLSPGEDVIRAARSVGYQLTVTCVLTA